MESLRAHFESLGLESVSTHGVSGNVAFQTKPQGRKALTAAIEKKLLAAFGDEIAVFLRTAEELGSLVGRNPFSNHRLGPKAKPYVTFLKTKLAPNLKTPVWSAKRDVQIIETRSLDLICIAHQRSGRFGFPNNFVEAEFDVIATTRGWPTIEKVAALAASISSKPPPSRRATTKKR